jgi:hypothetical protein
MPPRRRFSASIRRRGLKPPSPRLLAPFGIAIDAAGDLLVFDQGAFSLSGAVIRIDPVTGAQSTVSSGGSFVDPFGIALVPEPVATSSDLTLAGTTDGGNVALIVSGVSIQVTTKGGASAAQVAVALAAAINANATLGAVGITATAAGGTVTTNGRIDSVTINDPGLEIQSPPQAIPALSPEGLILLGLLLLAVRALRFHRRGRSPEDRRPAAYPSSVEDRPTTN